MSRRSWPTREEIETNPSWTIDLIIFFSVLGEAAAFVKTLQWMGIL